MSTPFDISATREGSRVVLSVRGELDLATVPRMQKHVEAALRLGADPLVADVSQLTFMDSTGLRLLLATHDRATHEGRRFVVVNGSQAVDRIFALTLAQEVLTVVPSLGDA